MSIDELTMADHDVAESDSDEDHDPDGGGGDPRKAMQRLLDAHAAGRGPAAIARDTGGRVLLNTVIKYWDGNARDKRMPALATIQGLSDALGLPDDTEVSLALLRDMGARIRPPGTALARSLPQIAYVLDDHPDLVAALSRAVTQMCLALTSGRRQGRGR
jgi:hypothetical protein